MLTAVFPLFSLLVFLAVAWHLVLVGLVVNVVKVGKFLP